MGGIDRQREGWVDAARGIAIILVVLGHVIHIVERQLSLALPGFDVLDRVLYSFHVPVFFLLSGMFLFRPSVDGVSCGGLLWCRAKRLLYPYLLWSVVQTTLDVASQAGWRERLAPELFQILYFPQAHFWFLYVLFFCGAIGVALRAVLVCKRRTIWVLLAMSLAWYGLHPLIPGGPIKDIGVYLPYLALGALWASDGKPLWRAVLRGRESRVRGGLTAMVVLVGLFVCAALFAVAADVETDLLLRLPIGLLGVASVLAIAYRLCASREVRWLTYIGRNSMAIYLIHVLAVHAVFVLTPKPSYPAAIGLAMVAGIGLPLIFKEVCGRLHITKQFGLK